MTNSGRDADKNDEADENRDTEKKETATSADDAGTTDPRPSILDRITGRRTATITAAVAVVAVVAAVVFGVVWGMRGSDLDTERENQQARANAEQIAGDYAVGAAQFDFRNLDPWAKALKKGTADSLDARFDVAVQTLTPLLQEIQWVQTAKLMAAKTTEIRDGRHYVVQVFVSTHMTSTQNPEGMSTVTPYTVTLDREDDWRITDVAGIAGSGDGGSGNGGSGDGGSVAPGVGGSEQKPGQNAPEQQTPEQAPR